MTSDRKDVPLHSGRKSTGKGDLDHKLPHKFYKEVGVEKCEGGFVVLLDSKSVRTPKKNKLVLPSKELAEEIAIEWSKQGDKIDPATMPLLKHANTAIDLVQNRKASVIEEIVCYANSDLLCYRAEEPEALIKRQRELWDPILAWLNERLKIEFKCAQGVMPVNQSGTTLVRIRDNLESYDVFELAALHNMTTLMGSAILGLTVLTKHLTAEEAWRAANVDEDWQIAKWGEDDQAAARRQRQWRELQAASQFVELLGSLAI